MRPSHRTVSVLLLALAGAGCPTPEPGIERGEALFDTCMPCHGSEGRGNRDLGAPSIAGLPQWYVQSQLENYQQGIRGYHPDDLAGLRMKPMAISLDREGDVSSVAEYVASLSTAYSERTLTGDAGAGSRAFGVCVACHGPDARGNELLGAPPLVTADDWYLFAQLQKFRSGQRGTDARDTWGATMRANALALDDQAMLNVLAYIRTLR